jgi:hypothetical protein
MKYIIMILFVFSSLSGFAQEKQLSDIVTEIAETLASDETDPEAASIFNDRIHELIDDPVKINSAVTSEISRLFFLSDFQVKALVDYVTSSGKIVSVYELANIPGFDRVTAEMIIPFITLDYEALNSPDSVRWRNSFISNFSLRRGNGTTASLGSDWKVLAKYKFSAGAFSGGITTEKDPGEKFLTGSPPAPDFLSAHLAFKGKGILKKLIIGDFAARFGQGTNINTGIQRGVSLVSPGYMSSNDEIKPYTSTEENKFFRGMASELSFKNFGLSMFLSKNYSDATLSQDSSGSHIETITQSGVHNTPSLLNKKDAISQLVYGLILSYNMKNMKAGIIWSGNRLSLPMNFSMSDPQKIFDFRGSQNNLYTVYYNLFIKKVLLYEEFTLNNDDNYAFVLGSSFRPADRLSINILFRDFSPGFTTFYGHGPGTSSKSSNETGILGNFTFEAAKHLFISGGVDIQHFPWLKYRCSAPSMGVRKEIKLTYMPLEKVVIDATYNYKLSMYDDTGLQGIPDQSESKDRSFKVAAKYSLNSSLTFGFRADYKFVEPSSGQGFVLCQDVNYNLRNIPVSIWGRFCLFSTGNWDSRIYTYENDLLYSLSIPALAGKGSRSYVMVKWKVSDFAEVRIKYGISSIMNAGLVENIDEIKMQFRIWF